MNRRAFLTGLLTAPMIVRATSLDALPRGVPLYGNTLVLEWKPKLDGFFWGTRITYFDANYGVVTSSD